MQTEVKSQEAEKFKNKKRDHRIIGKRLVMLLLIIYNIIILVLFILHKIH